MSAAIAKVFNFGGGPGEKGGATRTNGLNSLAAFAADEEMRSVMAALAEAEWPDAVVEAGGLAAAAAYLNDASPPDVLVVDLGTSQQPYEDLMAFSDVCDPRTQVIAVGEVNDLGVYRRIVGAGVVDYLVKPVTGEDLAAALMKVEERQPETEERTGEEPKIIVVIGSRGGIGTSMVAANGAWLMAETMDKKTVLLDLDVQFGTSALSMDILPSGGLVEALQHPDRVDSLFLASAVTQKTKKLSILAAEEDLGRDATFEPEGFDRMLSELGGSFEWIWIDLPRTMTSNLGDSLDHVQHIIIVSDLSLAGMRDTLRLKTFCKSRAPHVETSVLLNRVNPTRGDGLTVSQFERGIEDEVVCEIAEDFKNASAAATAGKPLAELTHKKKLMTEFKAFVRKIGGADADEPEKKSFLSGKVRRKK